MIAEHTHISNKAFGLKLSECMHQLEAISGTGIYT